MSYKRNSWVSFEIIIGVVLIFAIFWFYRHVLWTLGKNLSTNEDYSFGLLLPFVSAYIVYLKWPQISRIRWQPSCWGLAVIGLGMLLFLLGELATDLYISTISFMVVLAGLVYLMGGWESLRQLAFPFLILILMIPLPFFITQKITLPLQLLSSRIATELLHGIGVPAIRQGNIIDLGVRQLQVVAACSGLRYILSLVALAIIYCYFYQRQAWKVVILLCSIIPAAIIANALRVAGMGLFPALQEGFWHGFSGWLIFIFCFGFLGSLNWLLNYLQPPPPLKAPDDGPKEKVKESYRGSYGRYLLVALGLVILVGPFALSAGHSQPVPLRQSFANFPMQLGPWQGRHVYIDQTMVAATACDAYLNAEYLNSDNQTISLWIAYYENQKAGGSVHSPFSCLTGGGWVVKESKPIKVGPGMPVRYMVMDQGGNLMAVYYWYIQRDRWIINEYLNKFYMAYDRLASRRANGALVRIITPVGKNVESADERLASFTRLLIPVLPEYIGK
jgi:exosortase D (VPLPA-CTERM-specific)